MPPEPDGHSDLLDSRLMTMKIIAGALMMGVVTFGAVVIFLNLGKEPGDPFLAYLAAGLGVASIFMQAFITAAFSTVAVNQLRSQVNSGDDVETQQSLLGIFQTRMIIGLALLEGMAFLNLVAYLIETQWWSLAVVAALLLFMAAGFPTRFKVESWIENKQQELTP